MANTHERQGRLTRALVYLARLFLFAIVPGIHLIVSGRKALGYTLVSFIVLGSLASALLPWKIGPEVFQFSMLWFSAAFLVYLTSIAFIVADVKSLGVRKLENRDLAVAMFALAAIFWPDFEADRYEVYNEAEHQMCPAICFGDIVVYEKLQNDELADKRIEVGDIVIYEIQGLSKANRVIAKSGQIVCQYTGEAPESNETLDQSCDNLIPVKNDELFVSGDNPDSVAGDILFHNGTIRTDRVIGVKPVPVANWPWTIEFTTWIYTKLDRLGLVAS